jgi:hypothetical protein
MKFTLTIKLLGLPKGLNTSGGHWRDVAKDRKSWRTASYYAAKFKAPLSPLKQCSLICTRHSSVPMDEDNEAASFKSIIDGLVDAKIFLDDNRLVILERSYRWEKAPAKKGFVTVTITEL